MKLPKDITQQTIDSIKQSISDAEAITSAEMRVHIETNCKKDSIKRAAEVFDKLNMYNTKQHNAILFYLAVESKHFAVIGDMGIDKFIEQDFWNSLKDEAIKYFKDKLYAEGFDRIIKLTAEKIKEYYPIQPDDINELSDEISIE